MAGLSMSGLASGLDTASIISQLMSIERQPRLRIERNQAAEQARRDALNDVQTKLKSLRTASLDLKSASTWLKTQQLTTSDANRVAVKLTGDVEPRTYNVTVQRLATVAEARFDYTGGGTLEFTPQGGPLTSVDLSTATSVDDAVALVNARGLSVTAANVGGKLQLLSNTSGGGGNFTATGASLSAVSTKTGVDAAFEIDGVPGTATTNVVTALPGAELTLKGLTVETVSVTATASGLDQAAVKSKIKAFVDAYNATVDAVRSRTTEKRVANPTNTIDARKGVLFNDGGLNQVLSSLRSATMEPLSTAGNTIDLDELAEFGISTGKATGGESTADSLAGKLVIDDAKLTAALADNPASVERLFAGTAGFGARMETLLTPMTETGGTLAGRLEASDSLISRLKQSLTTLDERLARKETQLRKQFTALETALGRAQAQQASMTSQLAGLPRMSS